MIQPVACDVKECEKMNKPCDGYDYSVRLVVAGTNASFWTLSSEQLEPGSRVLLARL